MGPDNADDDDERPGAHARDVNRAGKKLREEHAHARRGHRRRTAVLELRQGRRGTPDQHAQPAPQASQGHVHDRLGINQNRAQRFAVVPLQEERHDAAGEADERTVNDAARLAGAGKVRRRQ